MADENNEIPIPAKNFAGSTSLAIDVLAIIIIGVLAGIAVGILGGIIIGIIALLLIMSMSIRVVKQWDRMPVLRFGRYTGIIGPGIFAIMPFIDRTPINVDLRVISTVFSAEKTLTKDNVPVDVEAILFWRVTNPEQAVLEVQDYISSVQLAAQTALRDVIGKNELSLMLAGRNMVGENIKELIQERISPWGIIPISVEIRDVTIPQELQNAMARVATSDREKQARVILAESESLAADKMLEAAEKYHKDIYAMQLRSLNMMYEISLTGKNLMVFIPTESKGFSIPTPVGVMGIQDVYKNVYQNPDKSDGGNQAKEKKKGGKQ